MAGTAPRKQARKEAEALMALNTAPVKTKKTEVLIKHIAAEAKNDPDRDGAGGQDVAQWLKSANANRTRSPGFARPRS